MKTIRPYLSIFKFLLPGVACVLSFTGSDAFAANPSLFWDNNGLATPSSGTWDNTTSNWAPTNLLTASTVPFVSNSFAQFTAGTTPLASLTITVPISNVVVCAGLTTAPSSGAFVSNTIFAAGGSGAQISVGTNGQQGIYCPLGGSIQFNLPIVGTNGGLALSAGGPIILNATNTYTGGTTIGTGATLVLGPTGELNGGNTYSGTIPNSGTLVFSNNTATLGITGTISGSGNVNVVNCAATTNTVAPAGQVSLIPPSTNLNSYTGITSITNGYLLINNDGGLGADPSALVTNNLVLNMPLDGHIYGLRLQSSSVTLNSNRGLYFGTNGTSANGVVGGALNVQAGNTLTVAGPITGPGAFSAGCNGSFGNGVVVLSNANNTYAGATFIADGTLQLGVSGALPFGTPLTLYTPAGAASTFNLNTNNQTIGPLQTAAALGGTGTATPIIKLTGALTVIQTNISTTFSGVISNAGGSLTISSSPGATPATLTLTGSNTYSGPTVISGATLALGASGSINFTPSIAIAAGGTFDVSAPSAYTLSTNTTLSASGAGTGLNTTAATLNGAVGGTINLGSQAIALAFTPATFNGDSAHPALYVSQAALTLSGNVITVTNASALPLGAGVYVLIQAPTITGTVATNVTVTGAGTVAGTSSALSVSGGNVILTVTGATTYTRPTITSFRIFNNSLFLSATNGTPNGTYVVLQTTNLALPENQWTPVLTNTFDASGNTTFSTNLLGTNRVEFYSIQNP